MISTSSIAYIPWMPCFQYRKWIFSILNWAQFLSLEKINPPSLSTWLVGSWVDNLGIWLLEKLSINSPDFSLTPTSSRWYPFLSCGFWVNWIGFPLSLLWLNLQFFAAYPSAFQISKCCHYCFPFYSYHPLRFKTLKNHFRIVLWGSWEGVKVFNLPSLHRNSLISPVLCSIFLPWAPWSQRSVPLHVSCLTLCAPPIRSVDVGVDGTKTQIYLCLFLSL